MENDRNIMRHVTDNFDTNRTIQNHMRAQSKSTLQTSKTNQQIKPNDMKIIGETIAQRYQIMENSKFLGMMVHIKNGRPTIVCNNNY